MPNSTSDEIQAHEIVTTTSAPFTISIDVDDAHTPTFETFYQALANSLIITLETSEEDEDIDPDDPSGERDFGWGPQFEDDEEEWVPWEKMRNPMAGTRIWSLYSGRVPAVVHPTKEGTPSQRCLHAGTDMPGQVVLPDETSCKQHSLIHYLNEGARGPTFVDRDAIHELLAEDPVERELRAPILEPVVSSPPEGGELAYRYDHPTTPGTPQIYVGETWAKKVADKDRYQAYTFHPHVRDSLGL